MDSKRNGELSVIKNVKLDRRVKVTNHIEVGSENMQLGWIDFSKEDRQKAYDKENKKPVIKASICNGEQVAGFKDIHTGRIEEIMLIKNRADLDS